MDEDLTVQAQEATPLRLEGELPDAGRKSSKLARIAPEREGKGADGGGMSAEKRIRRIRGGDTGAGRGQRVRNPDRLRMERIRDVEVQTRSFSLRFLDPPSRVRPCLRFTVD